MAYRHPALDQNGDRRPLQLALLAAILAHLFVLYLTLPQPTRVVHPDPGVRMPIYDQPLPPPPLPEPPEKKPLRPLEPRKELIPIPDMTPDELEPIREAEPDPESEEPHAAEITFPNGSVPPAVTHHGPLFPGIQGVSEPIRIHDVQPRFPPMARRAGIRASVRLQAIITAEGEVRDITVLYSSAPGLGFEQAAIEAVEQWRYRPAEQDGTPVSVYFVLSIDFELQ